MNPLLLVFYRWPTLETVRKRNFKSWPSMVVCLDFRYFTVRTESYESFNSLYAFYPSITFNSIDSAYGL